jgi:hypothetical protein
MARKQLERKEEQHQQQMPATQAPSQQTPMIQAPRQNRTCNIGSRTQGIKGGTNLMSGWIGSEPLASAGRHGSWPGTSRPHWTPLKPNAPPAQPKDQRVCET